jgi:hypothetical protein
MMVLLALLVASVSFHLLVLCSGEKGLDIDCHMVEFDDVRYHIQVSAFFLGNQDCVFMFSAQYEASNCDTDMVAWAYPNCSNHSNA